MIKNFKNISNLLMENIPDLVVIAGPNGSGKTSIFEAIRVFKAAMGPYTNQDMNIIQQEVNRQLGNYVALDKEEATISISFELSSNEKSYLEKHGYDVEKELTETSSLLQGTVTIKKSGGISPSSNSRSLSHLLSHFDPTDELGAIMYIPAFRDLPRGDIGNITLSPDWAEQQKTQIIANIRAKFQMMKQNFVTMFIYDQIHSDDETVKFIPQVQKIFRDFFFPKEFQGVDVDRALAWHFPIKYKNHTHDVDYLSSGEKEILMTFTEILKLQLTGSIILFDEPDLHLNAALEKKVISNLDRIVKEGNQIWAITHSLEIIGVVPIENLYRMRLSFSENEETNAIELCSDKKDVYEIFNNLGASTGIQLISDKIVYVEGPSDVEILRIFYEEFGDKLSFIETKGVRGIHGMTYVVRKLMDQATKYDSFLMIRDRDFLDDNEREEFISKYDNRAYVLTARNIENLLLNPIALQEVFKSLGVNIVSSDEMKVLIKKTADKFKIKTIKELTQEKIYRLFNNVNFGLPSISSNDITTEIMNSIIPQRNSHVEKLQDSEIKKIVIKCKNDIETNWEDKWDVLCDGKAILQGLINDHLAPAQKSIDLDAFRSLIANKMKDKNLIPSEIFDFFKKHGYEIVPKENTHN